VTVKGVERWSPAETSEMTETEFNGITMLAYKNTKRPLISILEETAAKLPGKTALVFQDKTLTYGELWESVQVMAANLKAKLGLTAGERVAVLMNNRLEFVMAFFAAGYCGAIVCALNARLAPREIEYMLKDSGARILIAENSWLQKLKNHLPETDIKIAVNAPDAAGEIIGADEIDFATLFDNGLPKFAKAAVDPETAAMLLYTSGTTGHPKGVMITHFNALNAIISYAKILHISAEDKTVIAVPLFYITGLLAQMLLFVYLGGTIYIMKEFHGRELLQILEKEKISFFHATAAIYNIMLQTRGREEFKLRHLRMAVCGGSPITGATSGGLLEWLPWLDFRSVYGLTESSSPSTIYPRRDIFAKKGSSGLPLPVLELKIIDEWGEEAPVGEVGEITIRGAVVVPGYWNKDEANRRALRDGWLKTGDLGKVDSEGYIYVLDRKKDMIIRGGENVYSSEVENVLLEHPKILEAAVVGIPDEVMGEEIKACLVLKPGETLTAEEIKLWAGNLLAKFKIPKYMEFYDSLPRNANGKVLKAVLKNLNK